MPLLKDDTKEQVRNTLKESSLILLYECLGTALLSGIICNYFYEGAVYEVGPNKMVDGFSVDNTGLLLGIFVTIMFSARISGSHYNPCITFSYMIGNVKHGNFDRMLGFLYIAAQFAGAMLGGILSGVFSTGKGGNQIQLNVPGSAMF